MRCWNRCWNCYFTLECQNGLLHNILISSPPPPPPPTPGWWSMEFFRGIFIKIQDFFRGRVKKKEFCGGEAVQYCKINDPDCKMIPRPQMIPKMNHKWSSIVNYPHCWLQMIMRGRSEWLGSGVATHTHSTQVGTWKSCAQKISIPLLCRQQWGSLICSTVKASGWNPPGHWVILIFSGQESWTRII